MNKDELDPEITEAHIKFLESIVSGIGSMAMEYWSDREERGAEAALQYLASIARSAPYHIQRLEDENERLRTLLEQTTVMKREE